MLVLGIIGSVSNMIDKFRKFLLFAVTLFTSLRAPPTSINYVKSLFVCFFFQAIYEG